MTRQEMREAHSAGNSPWEVLHMVVASGVEYPDAVYKVSQALRMDDEEVAEMEEAYTENC